ncbi:S41 family peptidase [Porphyromonas pogonae]|uniref:S41 family peptidase n=1 Tax=Porphyromonas pogonae TaxID=867595 RepID=UPI002E78D291|nr:S41 family peptidase [Porphyromonas pogonae]
MKQFSSAILSLFVTVCIGVVLPSCSTEGDFDASPQKNYDKLWQILDERYCYFEEKLPKDSTWRDMYYKHVKKISPNMGNDSLLSVMCDLLDELRDGHVNIITPFNYGRYWNWHLDYPKNFDVNIIDKYLERDYKIAGGAKYRYLKYNNHAIDSIGYIRFPSFASPLSTSNLNAMLSRLSFCRALIIDIRENGGGDLSTSDRFAQHFLSKKQLVGYISHKTGPGHNDFSKPTKIQLDTLKAGVKWFKPVILLTNRGSYSSANDFALKMKNQPFVTLMGDKTGGGGGLPLSSELPNGWAIRFSACKVTDSEMKSIENGIEPHYYVSLRSHDIATGKDTLIEEAIAYINKKYEEYRRTHHWNK